MFIHTHIHTYTSCTRWKSIPLTGVKLVSNSNKDNFKTRFTKRCVCGVGWFGYGGVCMLFRKEREFTALQSAYKYSINFSRFHNGMAVQFRILCPEFEMKLLWWWEQRGRQLWWNGRFLSSNFLLFPHSLPCLIAGDTNPISALLVTALMWFCVAIPPRPLLSTCSHKHTSGACTLWKVTYSIDMQRMNTLLCTSLPHTIQRQVQDHVAPRAGVFGLVPTCASWHDRQKSD